ncbi:hypothetical protein PCANC_17047 [Puccinia coronata f. sp. avenae]|uniref:Arginase n=1 Tax=Puccinia coronata f. sp. avenae TaxID=200324 RepID=A0A2N5SNY4_9BASI|nr:hypothetical protein PCANC_17047 [Puccinia coronata f. sp. avenae]
MSSTDSHKFLKKPRVAAVIPCPFSGGQPRPGVDDGPSHLIQDGLIKSIESVGYSTVVDQLNLSAISKEDDPDIGILKTHGCGTLNAFPEACVIWVDAHADINTPDTTETGNLHGCPVSFLLSSLHAGKDLEPFKWIKPYLKPDRLVYIGLRDIDMGERKS